MLNLNSFMLFSDNPKKLKGFYEKVLEMKPDWNGGDFVGFQVGSGHLVIGPHDKVKGKNSQPERMMLNLETKDVKGEFDRILGIGAKLIAKPYHPAESTNMWVATLSDPDGNYFQLTSPMD